MVQVTLGHMSRTAVLMVERPWESHCTGGAQEHGTALHWALPSLPSAQDEG